MARARGTHTEQTRSERTSEQEIDGHRCIRIDEFTRESKFSAQRGQLGKSRQRCTRANAVIYSIPRSYTDTRDGLSRLSCNRVARSGGKETRRVYKSTAKWTSEGKYTSLCNYFETLRRAGSDANEGRFPPIPSLRETLE